MYKAKQTSISSGQLMELFIETLTGSSMILYVSPLDTVFDVKTYIHKLEGIPASQQHLVWQYDELANEQSLQDCHIHNGATLRLVLNMQGGPINTRHVPVEEPTLVEYSAEGSRSDVLSSTSNHHRPMTVVVCHSRDHLKFYQFMPGTDVSSPLSCPRSSTENNLEVDKALTTSTEERREENQKTRDKMKLVRSQMEMCSLLKEKKDKMPSTASLLSRPPSTGCPVVVNNLRHSSLSGTSKRRVRIEVVPPREMSTRPSDWLELLPKKESSSSPSAVASTLSSGLAIAVENKTTCHESEVLDTHKKRTNIPSLSSSVDSLPSEAENKSVAQDNICRQDAKVVPAAAAELVPASITNRNRTASESGELGVGRGNIKVVNKPLEMVRMADPTCHGSKSLMSSLDYQLCCDRRYRPQNARSNFTTSAGQPPSTSTKRTAVRNEGNVVVCSLDSREARLMSGLLTSLMQGSGSRLALPGCYKLVRNSGSSVGTLSSEASHHRPIAMTSAKDVDESGTPRCSTVLSSTHLPAIGAPKTSANHCGVCKKKTSLATSFQCRCGGNFCGLHRYAEAHSCGFDYKSEGRRLIQQNNPLITAEKLPKI